MNKLKKVAYYVSITVLIIISVFLASKLIYWLYNYYTANKLYEDVSDEYTGIGELSDEFPDISIDVEGLLKENDDFCGWIYYEDGKVNLPIVKEKEDEINKYEKYTFDGKKNSSGTLFIPYDASLDFNIFNTYIYGHNMKNGTMFGSLKLLYRDKTNIQDPYFYVWTANGERIKYRVISIYPVNMNDKLYAFPKNEEEQKEYLEKIMKKGSITNLYPLDDRETEKIESNASLVTLYTCYGKAGTSTRLFVQGIEIFRERYLPEKIK